MAVKKFEREKEVVWYPGVATNFSSLYQEVKSIDDECRDMKARYEFMSIGISNGIPVLNFINENGYEDALEMTPHSFSQLCTKVGVPSDYMGKCLISNDEWAHELAAENVNYWLGKMNKEAFCNSSRSSDRALLRLHKNKIRGFLTDKYSTYDNVEVAEVLMNNLSDDEFRIVGKTVNEEVLHARIVSRHELDIKGDESPLFWGFYIDNSDVGRRSLSLSLMIWRQNCKNGLIVPLSNNTRLVRSYHKGDTSYNTKKLMFAFSDSERIIDNTVELINSSINKSIVDRFDGTKPMQHFVDEVKARTGLSTKSVGKVMDLLSNDLYPKTQWGLINAITEHAQDYSLERRIQLEASAGKLLLAA